MYLESMHGTDVNQVEGLQITIGRLVDELEAARALGRIRMEDEEAWIGL